MNYILKILAEKNGNPSFTRYMSAVFGIIYAVHWVMSIFGTTEPPRWEDYIAVGTAFGLKIIQKPFEKGK